MKDVRTYLSNHFSPDWSWRVASAWLYGPRQKLLSLWQFSWYLQGLNRTHPQSSSPVSLELWVWGFWSIWMLSLQVVYSRLLSLFTPHSLCEMCMLGSCFAVRFISQACTELWGLWQPLFVLQVRCGLVVVAYKDGSPAHPHFMDPDLCSQYWNKWLLRLEEYMDKNWPRLSTSKWPETKEELFFMSFFE